MVSLYGNYGVMGVLALMITLLIVQIFVVALLGIESSRRGLESLVDPAEGDAAGAPAMPLSKARH